MCILFVCVSSIGSNEPYRLVLASNRDEDFSRPARQADFWKEFPNIIGGVDCTPGKEGGTWLGAEISGQVGVLLNYPFATADPSKKGRGFLVNDYLTSGQSSGEFLSTLAGQAEEYNPFHLVTVDLSDPTCTLRHFCNADGKVSELASGFHAFCNSSLDRPYKKAKVGLAQFQSVVVKQQQTSSHDDFAESLLGVLRSEEKHYPDEILETLPMTDPSQRSALSSIFVKPDVGSYGTRTSTVILVSKDGTGHFYEWTLKLPVENQREWLYSYKQFKIGAV